MENNLKELQAEQLLEISGGTNIIEDAIIVGALYEWNRRLAIGMWNRIVEKWND